MYGAYRAYCSCCCNYKILHRYTNGNYFCHSCSTKLGKLGIAQLANIQQELADEKKITRRDYRASQIRKWKALS